MTIVATTYIAWQLIRNRQIVERYLILLRNRNVTTLIKMRNLKIDEGRGANKQKRRRKGSSRKGQRPVRYRQIQGARIRKVKKGHNLPRFLCLAAVAMVAKDKGRAQITRFDSDSKMIRVDNCASYCISNDKADFITELKPIRRKLKGLGGTLAGIQTGTIRWRVQDDLGAIHEIELPNSLYVPESPSKLLSPQHWAQTAKDHRPLQHGTWCATYHDRVVLHWNQRTAQRTIALNQGSSNVAALYTAPGYENFKAFCGECEGDGARARCKLRAYNAANQVSDDEEETSDRELKIAAQREQTVPERADLSYIRDLWKQGTTPDTFDLNAEGIKDVPRMVETEDEIMTKETPSTELLKLHQALGHLSMRKLQTMATKGIVPRRLAKCQLPLCGSCMYGKATRRPWRTKPTKGQKMSKLRTATTPGQCVSVDQLEFPAPGLIAQMKGWLTKKRYRVATVFVDNYSGMSYVHMQKTTNAEETLMAKEAFKRYASKVGVKVLEYQADNGRFAEADFVSDAHKKGQTLKYCGVNAHFQNAVAERRIRLLQDHARTMLLHAKHRWPDAIETSLWPYATRAANEIHNATPDVNRYDDKSPTELFTGSQVAPNLQHIKPFGCPVYVLDNAMQAGKKISKWEIRSRLGIYLGMSPHHARSVALVLNLETGHVSPQFHVKFDSKFETVRAGIGVPKSKWQRQCYFGNEEAITMKESEKKSGDEGDIPESETLPEGEVIRDDDNRSNEPSVVDEGAEPRGSEEVQETITTEPEMRPVVQDPGFDDGRRRSTRANKAKSRYDREGVWVSMEAKLEEQLPYHVAFETCADFEAENEAEHPMMAYAASADPDTMYFHEAMKEPDREEFVKAMQKEVESHTANEVWELVPASKMPKGIKPLPAVWAMKRKRKIATREVYKWKARLNIDGSKQEHGINYWETFSPVASWAAIRLVLINSLMQNWETRQVDFVLAYTQADVECDLYMKVPKGFEMDAPGDYVLKLKKNLFGQKQAGRVWNQHLPVVNKLHGIGFRSSEIDECLFYRGSSVFVL